MATSNEEPLVEDKKKPRAFFTVIASLYNSSFVARRNLP